MSNTLYDSARALALRTGFAWDTGGAFNLLLIDTTSYTPNFSTHVMLTDIPSAAITNTGCPSGGVGLASMAVVAGAANANNVTFSAITGVTIGALVLYKNTGTGSTSNLIAWIDTATGLPITPNGGDIIVSWDTGPNKIFKL